VVEIFEKTPFWVWMLFGFLVVLGYLQTKERILPLARALIVPLMMFLFSLQGVVSLFGLGFAVVAWVLGLALSSKMALGCQVMQNITYQPQKKLFTVQGSWVWFWLIMGIFWLKYLLNVVSIISPLLLNVPWFFLGASFCLGALGGIFVARVFVMYRLWR
jgi:hypothetical protein